MYTNENTKSIRNTFSINPLFSEALLYAVYNSFRPFYTLNVDSSVYLSILPISWKNSTDRSSSPTF
jgi:hypothetical protein